MPKQINKRIYRNRIPVLGMGDVGCGSAARGRQKQIGGPRGRKAGQRPKNEKVTGPKQGDIKMKLSIQTSVT
jgi:hypothetical protein